MEDSEIQKHLLSLGRKLSNNFEDYNGDEISEWMAHYIAEKMTMTVSARGKTKASAQRECFEAILLLWEHQSYFPNDVRPFDDFEPVFRAIAHMDPNNKLPSFFRNENGNKQIPKDIEQYIEFITSLDAATRIMVSFIVREAIFSTADESTLRWLDAIKGIAKSDEAQVILKLVPELDVEDVDVAQAKKKKRANEISEQIDRLEAFERMSQYIKSALKVELTSLESR